MAFWFLSQVICSLFTILLIIPLKRILNGPLPVRFGSSKKVKNILENIKNGLKVHRGGIPENTIEAFCDSKSAGASAVEGCFDLTSNPNGFCLIEVDNILGFLCIILQNRDKLYNQLFCKLKNTFMCSSKIMLYMNINEVDLQFTKDGHPVLLHDYTVDRTSDGTGEIKSLTLREAKALDFGIKYGHKGARVPTLEGAVESIKELDLVMFLEIKSVGKHTIPTLLELFSSDSSLYDRIIVISFFPGVIYEVKKSDPNIIVGLLMRGTMFSKFADGTPRFSQTWIMKFTECFDKIMFSLLNGYIQSILNVSLVLPHKDDILSERFDLLKYRKTGIFIVTWTVNDKEEQNHFQDFLKIPYFTDNVHQ